MCWQLKKQHAALWLALGPYPSADGGDNFETKLLLCLGMTGIAGRKQVFVFSLFKSLGL